MVSTKLYLYDSSKADYKGTDYSANVLTGNSWTDDLTEVLDTAEVTLVGLPFSEEFAPTTKFIMELVDTETEQVVEILSLCVATDVVDQPILSDDTYFNHSITFNEASVIAQGRIVDDCSETFELKKVNLNSSSTYNPTAKAKLDNNPTPETAVVARYEKKYQIIKASETVCYKRKFEWRFTSDYLPQSDPNYGSASAWNIAMYRPINVSEQISLPVPLLVTKFGAKDSTDYENTPNNFCSVTAEVYESDDGVNWGDPIVSQDFNPSKQITEEYDWHSDWRLVERLGYGVKGYGMTRTQALNGALQEYYKKFADFDDTTQSRFITFTAVPNKQYCVLVKPKIFSTPLRQLGDHDVSDLGFTNYFYGDTSNDLYTYSYSYIHSVVSIVSGFVYDTANSSTPITYPSVSGDNGMPMMRLKFQTFVEGANLSVMFESAPAVSAYDLFKDALFKSQQTTKQQGVYIKDTPLAYYCNDEDINKLQNTEIIESSFHQKNFWEILLEVGKYIHAIPYIEFGDNDRFVVKWRYLGQTEKSDSRATTMSIFNSRSIENYVGALNSYVNNMVQRGAEIEEIIAPKSESEDYLVYNDVVVLKTTKPIIEITGLSFEIMNGNSTYYTPDSHEYDITDYIYEHNIYELLDVVASVLPNKGLAIYYNLGENTIRGLNYQLPSINSGDGETEYAIKRIIGNLIMHNDPNNWKNIRVNDFAFKIKYRTKEYARSEQSRPDLRKYLVNSAYEQFPHHRQFNNQQDVMVDSIKFGNQTYGKLIKTGNTEIQTTEWNNTLYELKRAGQLVDIRGNIYYVSKAKHTFFQDHIVSEITYSKDYNQLSEIIGIPSEPRFFEISEQSNVDRSVNINNMFMLSASSGGYGDSQRAFNLLFGANQKYPKYALTQLKNDRDNPNPSLGLSSFSIDLIHPISAYSTRNTLTLKWEMADNFSAGDRVDYMTGYYKNNNHTVDTEYSRLLPTQYTDKYGRADLVDYIIISDIASNLKTKDNIRNFPLSPYRLLNLDADRDYGNGTIYTGLYYREKLVPIDPPWDMSPDPSDPRNTPIPITAATQTFEIDYGGLGTTGDIFYYDGNNNEVSIIPSGQNLHNGDCFIINDNGTYCLFVRLDQPSDTNVFTNLYQTNDPSVFTSNQRFVESGNVFAFASSGYTENLFGTGEHGLALVKDNRERIAFNHTSQILTDSDRFVLSGYLWQQNKGTLQLALLRNEVNKIINDTIPSDDIITTLPITTTDSQINIASALAGQDLTDVKALALIDGNRPDIGAKRENYFIVARNVSNLGDNEPPIDRNWSLWSVNSNSWFEKQ